MGTLDDAIREHLELKRRSGAASDDLSRLEHEAFGPIRRDAPVPAAEPVAEPEPEDLAPPTAAPISADELPPPPVAPPPLAEPTPAPEPEPWLSENTAEFTAAEAREAVDTPPSDYVAPDDEDDAEDLLEETPDFLQETPEHDRLWFEQKPPRDFDFDN